ncbi:hypothetical protein F5Y18DRAFT_253950 [Xylariaceae sp. FL1019]|nr:hypothetical protein F5Y18DRAFT_253950 [Xylariaceae sp. FL1019]
MVTRLLVLCWKLCCLVRVLLCWRALSVPLPCHGHVLAGQAPPAFQPQGDCYTAHACRYDDSQDCGCAGERACVNDEGDLHSAPGLPGASACLVGCLVRED